MKLLLVGPDAEQALAELVSNCEYDQLRVTVARLSDDSTATVLYDVGQCPCEKGEPERCPDVGVEETDR